MSGRTVCAGLVVIGLVALAARASPGPFDTPAGVTRVEEDWELVIGTPDDLTCGPQITTTMSPLGDTTAEALALNINHRADPFQPGGIQLRAWSGTTQASQVSFLSGQCLKAGERITWTQRLGVRDGRVRLQVVSVRSSTWGNLGPEFDDYLTVSMPSSVATLDGYRPEETVANSGAGWQPNRVARMTLLRVRYYRAGQLVAEDATLRPVIAAADGS